MDVIGDGLIMDIPSDDESTGSPPQHEDETMDLNSSSSDASTITIQNIKGQNQPLCAEQLPVIPLIRCDDWVHANPASPASVENEDIQILEDIHNLDNAPIQDNNNNNDDSDTNDDVIEIPITAPNPVPDVIGNPNQTENPNPIPIPNPILNPNQEFLHQIVDQIQQMIGQNPIQNHNQIQQPAPIPIPIPQNNFQQFGGRGRESGTQTARLRAYALMRSVMRNEFANFLGEIEADEDVAKKGTAAAVINIFFSQKSIRKP